MLLSSIGQFCSFFSLWSTYQRDMDQEKNALQKPIKVAKKQPEGIENN